MKKPRAYDIGEWEPAQPPPVAPTVPEPDRRPVLYAPDGKPLIRKPAGFDTGGTK